MRFYGQHTVHKLYYSSDYLQFFRERVGACGIRVASPYPGKLEIDVFVPWWHYFTLWINEIETVDALDKERTVGLWVVCRFQIVFFTHKWKGILNAKSVRRERASPV